MVGHNTSSILASKSSWKIKTYPHYGSVYDIRCALMLLYSEVNVKIFELLSWLLIFLNIFKDFSHMYISKQ